MPPTGQWVGNENETAKVDGEADGTVCNFGDGDANNASNNTVVDGAVAAGGDATNVSNNDASQGGAVSGTGNAQGNFTDDDKDLLDDKDFVDDKDLVDIDDQDLVDVDLDAGHPRTLEEADPVFKPIELDEGPADLPEGAAELADS